MTSMSISETLFRRIAGHAGRTYPEECCGVLLGTEIGGGRFVHEILEIDNSQDANRRRRFLISPAQYRDAERQAEERRQTLLGFYHSHPDHPAIPSAFDTEHALPWFTYMIVSVAGGKAGHASAWMLEEDRRRFAEQPLAIDTRPQRPSNVK